MPSSAGPAATAAWSTSRPPCGVSAETLRKIETGRAPTPAFFTVAALATTLGLSLDELARAAALAAGDDVAEGDGAGVARSA